MHACFLGTAQPKWHFLKLSAVEADRPPGAAMPRSLVADGWQGVPTNIPLFHRSNFQLPPLGGPRSELAQPRASGYLAPHDSSTPRISHEA